MRPKGKPFYIKNSSKILTLGASPCMMNLNPPKTNVLKKLTLKLN